MALKLEILLEAIDRISGPIRRAAGAVAALGRSANVERLAAALGRVQAAAGQVAARLAVLGAGGAAAGFAFNRLFVRPAADAENLLAVLEQFEGTMERARTAMAWVEEFAARTPFELAEVGQAFVRLRALGFDAARVIQPAGEAAAALRVPLMQAVEAFADAAVGEFERLKEFGIRASAEGDRVTLRWMQNGREMSIAVDRRNQAMLQSTLLAIWNSSYEGAMQRLARTWDGMMSNLRASWTQFALRVMNAGVFDLMKTQLDRLQATLTRMAADGTLQQFADRVAAGFMRMLQALERFFVEGDLIGRVQGSFDRLAGAFEALRGVLEPLVGPFDALDAALVSLAAITFGPLIAGITGLGVALALIASNPKAMLAMAAITALAAAGAAIYANWEGIGDWFGRQMDGIVAAVTRAADAISGFLNLRERLRSGGPTPNDAAPPGSPERQRRSRGRWLPDGPSLDDLPELLDGGASPSSFPGADRVDVGGVLRIRIEDGRTTADGRLNDPRARLDINQGLLVSGA